MQLQRADMLALIGCWEEARKIYVALRQANGVDLVLERQILSLSLAIYDLENALPIARLLAQDEPAGRVLVARILYRLGRHEDAIQELREESLQGAIAPELYTLLGNILLEMHAFERAEDILAVASAMNRRTEDYVLLGRSLSAQGRRQEALSVLEKGLTLSRKKDPAGHFWRTYERVEGGLVALTPLPPLLGNIPAVTPGDVAIFFSADNTYFWQHGLVLLGSIARNWPSAKCHLHVVNPDAGVAQAIEVVRRLAPDLKLSYSYEQVDLERCSNTHIRTYYASVRFVRLAEIFAQAPATYLCVDADSIVRRDIEAEGCLSEIKDVGVRMRFDELPHMSLVASASMLRPTHKAAEFIDRVSSLIKPTLEAREAVWFLDQVVLSHVVRELGHKVGISQLDMTFLDWFFHDDSLIWTGKGRRKSDDDRYKREVSRCQYLQKAAEIAALMPEEVRASLRPTDRAVSPVSSLGT
jgi:tetratricopeptide (TPR) repeat protein